jgi:hypothetical protein
MVSKERKLKTQQRPNKNIIRADRIGNTRIHVHIPKEQIQ